MTQPERIITTEIVKALKQRGGWWVKIHGSSTQVSGIPDVIGCYRGRFVALEVKRPNAVMLSKRQRFMLKRIASAGGFARVVTSKRGALEVMAEIDSTLAHEQGTP